jgi:hypothetical protein
VPSRSGSAESRGEAAASPLSLADRLTQELEGDANALVDALKAGIRDKSATVRVRSTQAWIQLITGAGCRAELTREIPSISRP